MSSQTQTATCRQIIELVESAVRLDRARVTRVHIPSGMEVGQQLTIDATEQGGLLNQCRLSLLDVKVAPDNEVVRIEYEHDKAGKPQPHRVYSVQSVRRRGDAFVLLENFIADNPATVREADFRSIPAEAYAHDTVLKTLSDWVEFYRWQLQNARRH